MNKALPILPVLLFLGACSPHPGAGNWTATEENDWGIPGLTLSYEGRGLFTSKQPAATWHCFWGGRNKTMAQLDCTPSSNTEQEESFTFNVDSTGVGTLSREGEILGRFRRVEGKPEIP
ncbi:hypothetical protein [Thiolapillus sp.]